MNKEALERVAALVDKDQVINLSLWQYRPKQDDDDDSRAMQSCGYVCCAIGHAANDPWFNERGFKMTTWSAPRFVKVIETGIDTYKVTETSTSWDAVTDFFGVMCSEAVYLFAESSYSSSKVVTGAEVAERIRNFIVMKEEKDA